MQIGVFGLKPELLSDVLAGKRCNIAAKLNAYKRSFGGEQSPIDLEEALQLIYLLFTYTVTPVPEDLRVCATIHLQCIMRNWLR